MRRSSRHPPPSTACASSPASPTRRRCATFTLAATDPANPYGAALAWPAIEGVTHRPGRKAGGLVVIVDGALALYLERGGKSALAFTDDEAVLAAAAKDLAATARARRLDTLTIEQVNGAFVYGTRRRARAAGCRFRRVAARPDPAPAHRGRHACGSRRVPEGDTVYRAAKRLNEALAGAEVTRFDLRVPQAATVDLRGMTVHEVVPRGKHLLHRIGEWTLHSHLKMEGEWHVYPRGRAVAQARRSRPARSSATPQWDAVGFDLADIKVIPTRDEDQLVGHLGPDPLAADWDPAEAARRLGADDRAGARRTARSAQRRGVRQRVRERDPLRARHPADHARHRRRMPPRSSISGRG